MKRQEAFLEFWDALKRCAAEKSDRESALELIRLPMRVAWVLALGILLAFAGANISEAGSPRLVRDINETPAPQTSNPVFAGVVNGAQLFWTAPGIFDSRSTSARLWATDGTSVGTRALLDLRDPTVSVPDTPSFPKVLQVGNRGFFVQATTSYRFETWVTDGTPAGTRQLNLPGTPATGIVSQSVIGSIGDRAIILDSHSTSTDIWLSDGRASNTKRIASVTSNSLPIGVLGIVGSKLYYYQSSGTTSEIEFWVVSDTTPPTKLNGSSIVTLVFTDAIQVGHRLFFRAVDQVDGNELWAIDTDTDSVARVRDIAPGRDDSVSTIVNPWAAAIGDTLVFPAAAPGVGTELWRSDGTEGGTVLVKDIYQGIFPSFTDRTGFIELNGRAVFVAFNDPGHYEIWATDGTANGTVRLAEPPFNYNDAGPLTRIGNRAYFPMGNGNTPELWVTDGTPAGTHRVSTIAGANPGAATILGDDTSVFVYEKKDAGIFASETNTLWHYDPATDQAVLLKTSAGVVTTTPTFSSGRLYFGVTDTAAGQEPWLSDGTVAGTRLLKDIEAQTTASASPDELVALGSEIFFVADDGVTGRELWKSDGTSAGTRQVADLLSGIVSSSVTKLMAFNGAVYFFALDNTFVPRFWSIRPDGTQLIQLAQLTPPSNKIPYNMRACDESVSAVMGGTLYFAGASGLFKTDGTAAGTVRVALGNNANPCGLTLLGDCVYFAADGENSKGRELWSTDGTSAGTKQVVDLVSGVEGSSPTSLVAIGSTLYFVATDSSGPRLYKSDGTVAGTLAIDALPHNETWLSVNRLTPIGTDLYFMVRTDTQYQLWKTDGTTAGTERVDSNIGSSFANFRNSVIFGTPVNPLYQPNSVTLGNKFFFVGESSDIGAELYVLENERPVATADSAQTSAGVDTTITVAANDSDPDGTVNPATIHISAAPTNGTASVVNGKIVYRSNASFVGSDSLSYTIDDDLGQTSAAAVVSITVTAISTGPPATQPPSSQPNQPSGSGGGGGALDPLMLLVLAALYAGQRAITSAGKSISATARSVR
jgi:ELWxxDGT repeat protein